MIRVSYDPKLNAVVIAFSGQIDITQAEQSYSDIQKATPKHGKGFKILTDLSKVESMEQGVQNAIKRSMDYFNQHGVTEVVRVIPDPSQDIGFSIMSLFHYSKKVQILTVSSFEEANAYLQEQ